MASAARQLCDCARDGDLAGITALLAAGVYVDARHPDNGRTALMEAAASPAAGLELVRVLIKAGANVNASTFDGRHAAGLEKLENPDLGSESHDVPSLDSSRYDDVDEPAVADDTEDSDELAVEERVLTAAVAGGDVDKITALLEAGADVHYRDAGGYDALVEAMCYCARSPQLLPILRLFISRGANLDSISAYNESALRVASSNGRFDAVAMLLAAGADPAPLGWTPLMHAIALGGIEDVQRALQGSPDLAARDYWSRTPWLLSLHTGDVAKAKLLLAAGASRADRGRCGKPPLMYAVNNCNVEMLKWLLSEGFDPDQTDDFRHTPLMAAAELGATECAGILIDAGADIHLINHAGGTAITNAANLSIVRLLVARGANLDDMSREMRAELVGLPRDGCIRCSEADYAGAKNPRFGAANPEKINVPFWRAMVKSGACAYAARELFNDTEDETGAVWSFQRFGTSLTEIPDGRIIEIAGEHEDSYDPDFCIYNDVIVHHGHGAFDMYGYPEAVFPPTDFHTATLIGRFIYLIGSLGYAGRRKFGDTQVYRLETTSLAMEAVETSGAKPGWIHGHRTDVMEDGSLRISGGRICMLENDAEIMIDNRDSYVLDLAKMIWRRSDCAPPTEK